MLLKEQGALLLLFEKEMGQQSTGLAFHLRSVLCSLWLQGGHLPGPQGASVNPDSPSGKWGYAQGPWMLRRGQSVSMREELFVSSGVRGLCVMVFPRNGIRY